MNESIFETKLKALVRKKLKIQSGFGKRYDIVYESYIHKSTNNRETGSKVYVTSLDLEKAFDRILQTMTVWKSIHQRNINVKLIQEIRNVYDNNRRYIGVR